MKLYNIPFPPSSNKIYAESYKTRRKFKTKVALDFEADFRNWAIVNRAEINKIKEQLDRFEKNKLKFYIERDFHCEKEKLFCKDGRPKKFDVSNLIKVLDDQLCKVLGIDDAQIFYGSEMKTLSPTRFVNIHLEIMS